MTSRWLISRREAFGAVLVLLFVGVSVYALVASLDARGEVKRVVTRVTRIERTSTDCVRRDCVRLLERLLDNATAAQRKRLTGPRGHTGPRGSRGTSGRQGPRGFPGPGRTFTRTVNRTVTRRLVPVTVIRRGTPGATGPQGPAAPPPREVTPPPRVPGKPPKLPGAPLPLLTNPSPGLTPPVKPNGKPCKKRCP